MFQPPLSEIYLFIYNYSAVACKFIVGFLAGDGLSSTIKGKLNSFENRIRVNLCFRFTLHMLAKLHFQLQFISFIKKKTIKNS